MQKSINNEATKVKLLTEVIIDGMKTNKAEDIVLLDLTKIDNAVCKYFVICTGTSSTHIDGIAGSITRTTRNELKERPWHVEGKGTNEWVLLDFVDVVVHVFSKELRNYYDLEELWADALRLDVKNDD